MAKHLWIAEFPEAITVCDSKGIILEMNDRAVRAFQEQGGKKPIGKDLLDCHPENARAKLKRLMEARQRNVYTIQKERVRKLIYQSPWYKDGRYSGFVGISLEIPERIRNFVRED